MKLCSNYHNIMQFNIRFDMHRVADRKKAKRDIREQADKVAELQNKLKKSWSSPFFPSFIMPHNVMFFPVPSLRSTFPLCSKQKNNRNRRQKIQAADFAC